MNNEIVDKASLEPAIGNIYQQQPISANLTLNAIENLLNLTSISQKLATAVMS